MREESRSPNKGKSPNQSVEMCIEEEVKGINYGLDYVKNKTANDNKNIQQ